MVPITASSLPKRVFVGLYEFRIVLKQTGSPELLSDANDKYDGLTDFEPKAIYIDDSLSLKRLVNVVIHECTHAINWSQNTLDETSEEQFTENFANGFTQFWLDNPKMILWLNRAFKEIRKQQNAD